MEDHLDKLYFSESADDILQFYREVDNSKDLFSWMRKHTKEDPRVIVVEGEPRVVVVIPTRDANSPMAKQCRDVIFHGVRIIFVQSQGRNFNFSHAVNYGMKVALSYDPNWILYCNEDMLLVDSPQKLLGCLSGIDHTKYSIVYPRQGAKHSIPLNVSFAKKTGEIVYSLKYSRGFAIYDILKSYKSKLFVIATNRQGSSYLERFKHMPQRLFVENSDMPYVLTGDIGIFSRNYVESLDGKLFDETFINGCEDVELSIRLSRGERGMSANYSIGSLNGASLGKTGTIFTLGINKNRVIRDIANRIYLASRIESFQSNSTF